VEVERIAASDQFRRSARLAAMLRYVVEHTLTRGDTPLKEYRIGVEVFGRDPDYDTRLDPIVRVEMRRLRRRLADYYDASGRDDRIRIDVPRGSYGATIRRRLLEAEAVAARVPDRPAAPPGATAPPADPAGFGQAPATAGVAALTPASGGSRAAWLAIAAGLTLVVVAGLSSLRYPVPAPPPAGPTRLLVTHAVTAAHVVGKIAPLLDDIVAALSRIEGLRVVVAQRPPLAASPPGPHVDGVLALHVDSEEYEASRVSFRLTDSASGALVWAGTFERTAPGAGASIVRAVSAAIAMRVDPDSGQSFIRRGNDDEQAWLLYRQARGLANTRDAAAIARSLTLYEQAVARDPGYALAHAGIADARGVLLANGLVAPGVGLGPAQEAAARALALDPSLGEALAHLAYFEGFVNWRWAHSLADFRRAIALTPHHARTHAWYGQTLLALGRFDEAIDALLNAQRLDPAARSITQALGEAYYYAGRDDDVLVQARRLLQADPQDWGGHYLLARAAIARGDRAAALDALRRSQGELWSEVSRLVLLGDSEAARERLARDGGDLGRRQPFHVASLYALAGDPDRALAWLTRAVDERQADVASIAIDPPLRVLHDRPEFRSLVARVGVGRDASPTVSAHDDRQAPGGPGVLWRGAVAPR
jgi:serine/threonine-protein kinase